MFVKYLDFGWAKIIFFNDNKKRERMEGCTLVVNSSSQEIQQHYNNQVFRPLGQNDPTKKNFYTIYMERLCKYRVNIRTFLLFIVFIKVEQTSI